ncbi:LOW QUALITY PROTEIN: hypothetical protein U0070_016384, partial [Myodes glareolus]
GTIEECHQLYDEVNSNDNETHDIVKEYVYGDISKNYSQNFSQSTANSRAIPRTFGLKYPVNCTKSEYGFHMDSSCFGNTTSDGTALYVWRLK